MAKVSRFPLPFRSLRVISGGEAKPFIIGAMFTASYSEKAARLAASCEAFSLPYVLHEVPTVHSSTSVRGSDDLSFTKANFIHYLLKTHKKPVLYLDADCEFVSQPDLIADLVQSGCDFAIYNWLADEYTDRFYPVPPHLIDPPAVKRRYYRYRGSIDLYSTTQLIGAGQAQFYGNTMAARGLLSRWHQTVAAFPRSGDDPCLNFTYNNLGKGSWLYWFLKVRWLPKAYARVAYWIYAKPVINNPDIPAPSSGFVPLKDPNGRREFYQSLMKRIHPPLRIPRDCIIDPEQHLVCKLIDRKLVPVGRTEETFWL